MALAFFGVGVGEESVEAFGIFAATTSCDEVWALAVHIFRILVEGDR